MDQNISKQNLNKWLTNPNINPLTNRKISPQGAIYKKFQKAAEQLQQTPIQPPNELQVYMDHYAEWALNPNINPLTNRKISPQGAIYKKFQKAGTRLNQRSEQHEGDLQLYIDNLEEWNLNPNINPLTNRKISPHGRIYKKFEEAWAFIMDIKKIQNKKSKTIQNTQIIIHPSTAKQLYSKKNKQIKIDPSRFGKVQPCYACKFIALDLKQLDEHLNIMKIHPAHFQIYREYYNKL